MNKKLVWGVLLLLNVFLLTFSSCNNDDDDKPAKPAVELKEVGSGHDTPDDKIAYIGADVHIEAVIVAEGLIDKIEVKVRKDGSPELSKVYTDTKYVGKQNADFHEHLDIPEDAEAGDYRLSLTVTDKSGQSTTAESDLTLKAYSVSISIEGFTFGAGHDFPDNKIGYIGTAPVIEATSIKAENGIEKIYVMLHSEGETASYEMDTTYLCDGETELADFHKHISIPADAPAGDYHLHFKVIDKNGEVLEETMEIMIKETGIEVSDLKIGADGSAMASNIHTEFKVTATDPLKSIRVRVYKADATTAYFVDKTFEEAFADGTVKEHTFLEDLAFLEDSDAAPGEYVMEIRVNDNKGAYKLLKERLTIVEEE